MGIHEVMEQQTVSIAKAGITTTLNARSSILAAANPAYGRYDIQHSPTENINLPASLLSRFDLLWLMLDISNAEADANLASHVVYVHTHKKPPDLNNRIHQEVDENWWRQELGLESHETPLTNTNKKKILQEDVYTPLTSEMFRLYIALAREYEPTVPNNMTEWLAEMYVEMRKEESRQIHP